MTDKQQSIFFFLIVFFFTCGAGLLVYKQYDTYYQEKTATDLEAAVNLPVAKTSAPTVLADGRLQVDSPKEGGTAGQTFTVSGYAQGWFEGSIAIKVFDASSTLLYQGNAIAGDNYGHPAPFTSSIILTATSTTPTGKIEFNDYSAKDGSLVYQKVINIKFSSFSSPLLAHHSFSEGGTGEVGGGDISGWKTYKNEQYGFSFNYPQTWVLNQHDGFAIINSPKTAQEQKENPYNEYPGDLTVSVDLNPGNLAPKQFYDGQNHEILFDNPSQESEIKIDGVTVYIANPVEAMAPVQVFIIPRSSYFIKIDNNGADDYINQIISTFKFTN